MMRWLVLVFGVALPAVVASYVVGLNSGPHAAILVFGFLSGAVAGVVSQVIGSLQEENLLLKLKLKLMTSKLEDES
jgi:type III secretory pathway component EscS